MPALQSLIYALVQAGVRPNLAAWLDVGPSRAMQGLMAKNSELVQKKVRWALWQPGCCHCSLPYAGSAGVCRAAGHLLRQCAGGRLAGRCTTCQPSLRCSSGTACSHVLRWCTGGFCDGALASERQHSGAARTGKHMEMLSSLLEKGTAVRLLTTSVSGGDGQVKGLSMAAMLLKQQHSAESPRVAHWRLIRCAIPPAQFSPEVCEPPVPGRPPCSKRAYPQLARCQSRLPVAIVRTWAQRQAWTPWGVQLLLLCQRPY